MFEMFKVARQKVRNAIRDVRNGSMLWQKIKHVFRVRAWTSVALEIVLILILGKYTASRSDAFLSTYNLRSLLLATLPLALVTMAQVNALLSGYLDISVGSTMTIGVIIASFIITDKASPQTMALGVFAILGSGMLIGLFNATLVRWVKLPSIIATLATLSILDGISLSLRPIAAGLINSDFLSVLTKSAGFIPIAFVILFLAAGIWDLLLYATPSGLALRAVGHDAQASRRNGAPTTLIRVGALVMSGLMAAIASFWLAAQIGVGDPRGGSSYVLTSITAAVLGGTSLAGGSGTFIGAIVASLFLTMIVNVLPLLGLSTEVGLITIGVLMILGVMLYQVEDLKELAKLNYKRVQRLVRGSRLTQLKDLPKVYVADVATPPAADRKVLIKGGTVLTMDPGLGNFKKADVLIEGTKISAVGENLNSNGAEVVDASNTIVMPGFIDTHRHIWEGLLRNVNADIPLEGRDGYIRYVLSKFAPSYRPQDAYTGNLVSALGALDAGITTLLDWSHIQGSPEHTDAVVKALQDSGMRAVFAYGFPWWGDWNDRQPSWFVRAAKLYFSSKDQMLTYALAAPGPEFVDFEIARDHWKLAREVDARITTHVGVGSYGMEGKVQEMGEAGLLRSDTTYIHCTTLNDVEIQMIVDTGGTVSLAAPVEMMMGHGMPPIQKFLDRGLKPSLSVDVETNAPGDMFTQMHSVASLQHGLSYEKELAGGNGNTPERISSYDVLSYATIEGAKANGLAHKTGSLTPGKEADLILLRTDKPNVFPVNDPVGAVVWNMDTGNVDTVFVAGRLMKRNGKLLHVDWNVLKKAVLESRDYVMKKSGFKMPAI